MIQRLDTDYDSQMFLQIAQTKMWNEVFYNKLLTTPENLVATHITLRITENSHDFDFPKCFGLQPKTGENHRFNPGFDSRYDTEPVVVRHLLVFVRT